MEKLLTRFLQSGVLPNQLGVITPYEGQRAHVVATLLRHGKTDSQPLSYERFTQAAPVGACHSMGCNVHLCTDLDVLPATLLSKLQQ